VLVLGDQLDLDASAFDGFDPAQDAVWMAEVAEESTHIVVQPATHGAVPVGDAPLRRTAQAGRPVHYMHAGRPGNRGSLAAQLQADLCACARSGW
jgi:deoxyribodipyrimidine photolyase-related protein